MKARTGPRPKRHEAQAEHAARRIAGGAKAPTGWLSPHPAGSLPDWLGAGQPLATPLRQHLETAFDADLGALRVHIGDNAGRWLSGLGTQGAAGGHQIAIAPAAWHPHEASGLRLLAHEVAHTLQQAGEHRPDGRLGLVRREGPAAPQRDPDSMQAFYELDLAAQLDHIRAVHEAADGTLGAELATWFPDLRTALLALPDATAMGDWLRSDATTRLQALRSHPRQLAVWADIARLFDAQLGVQAVQTNPWIQTIHPLVSVREGLLAEARNADFWAQAITETWPAKLYFPEAFRAAIDSFLWTPPPAEGQQGVYAAVDRAQGRAMRNPISDYEALFEHSDDPRQLKPSEWVEAGLLAVVRLDAVLQGSFRRLDCQAFVTEDGVERRLSRFERMWERARQLQLFGDSMANATPGSAFGPFWWAFPVLAPIVTERAAAAEHFWTAAAARQIERSGSIGATGRTGAPGDVVPAYLQLPGFAAEMATPGTVLAALLPALLQVPQTRDRQARWSGFPAQAEAFASALDEQVVLPALERAAALHGAGQADLAAALAWFAAFAATLHWVAQNAVPAAIARLESPELTPDIALQARWSLAQLIKALSNQLASAVPTWGAVSQVLRPVDEIATDLGTSDLALPQPLELDDTAEASELILDQPGFNESVAPFTPADFANFFGRIRMEQLATALRAMLTARAADPRADINDLGLMAEAQRMLESPALLDQLPQRWLARETVWVVSPSDPPGRFAELLDANWRVRQLEQDETRAVLIPQLHGQAHGEPINTIAIWSVPRPYRLIQHLRSIPFFNALVHLVHTRRGLFIPADAVDPETADLLLTESAQQAIGELSDDERAAVDSMDDWTWWRSFADIRGIGASAGGAAAGVGAELASDFSHQVREVIALEQQATNADRALVRTEIARLLEDFSGRIGDLHLLDRVLQLLTVFHDLARPAVSLAAPDFNVAEWRTSEARLQASALVLELADGLAQAGTDVSLFSYRRDLFPWLSHAAADADALAQRADILGGSDEWRSDMTRQGRERLRAARTAMLATLVSFQTELAIQGSASGMLVSQLTPTRPLRTGTAVFDKDGERDLSGPRGLFRIEGVWVEIVEVLRDFTFFPRLGQPAARGAYQRSSRLVLGLVTGADEGANHVPNPKHPLELVRLRVGLAEDALHPVTITDLDLDNNRSGMAWLSHVVHMDASVQSMEALGRVVDAYGRGLMFVMSLTPVGWAVDVAELIGMMAEAFADNPDSVINQIEELLTEPDEVFRRLLNVIEQDLTAEHLLESFLLGGGHLRALAALMPNRRPSRARSPAVRRGIGGALARVRRLGAVVGARLQRLQAKVQPPVRALRGAILSRPSLATAVHWASDNWNVLTDPDELEGAILQHRIAGPVYEVANLLRLQLASSGAGFSSLADLEASVGSMAQRAQDMVGELRELELPEEIVPLEMMNRILLDAFLHFVSRRAPGKVRILSAIIVGAADMVGARDVLVEALSEQMRGTRFDPNTYWREFVVPEIAKPFTEAVRALADCLDYALNNAPLLGWFVHENLGGEARRVSVGTSTEADADFDSGETGAFDATAAEPPPEAGGASPLRQPGARARPAAASGGAPSTGSPLPPLLRERWESGFGHDLGHVRLHRGDDAARLTGRFGAAALTSGSRIFMAPGLSPASGLGERVLGHELAHVLQKTGPRPSGSDATPRRGRGGLRERPAEEAAADRMAARAQSGQGPVRIEGAHTGGASPTAADDVIPRFLGSISDMRAVTASLDAVTDAIVGPAATDLDTGVRRTANAIWSAISARIEAGSIDWPRFVPAAEHAMALRFLRRRLESSVQVEQAGVAEGLRNAGGMTDAVRVLARRAQRDAPAAAAGTGGSRSGAGAGAAAPVRKALAETTFVRELQLYLLGRTGMAMDFNVRVTHPSSGSAAPTVHIGSIEVEDIVLRWIPSDSAPWDEVMRRTWPTITDTRRHRQAAVRLIRDTVEPPDASLSGTAPVVWDGGFKFKDAFKTEVEDEINPPAISAGSLPDWNEFKNIADTAPMPANKAVIRLKKHADFTNGSWSLAKNDRQSHHTTQFLVAEYFHNEKAYKPFAPDRNWPASIAFHGSGADRTISSIASAGSGGDTIRVADTYPGRGGPMPAILLSASTHLGANLHVTPTADEGGTLSQGLAIHRHFVNHLPAAIRPESSTSDANRWLSTNATSAPATIYRAVQATYGDIRSEMMDKLTSHFPSAELNWYRRVAGDQFAAKTGNRSDSDLRGDLERIANTVATPGSGHNDTVMTGLGWDQRRGT